VTNAQNQNLSFLFFCRSSDERINSFFFFSLQKFIVHRNHYLQCLLLSTLEFDVSSRISSDASDASDDDSTGSDLSLAEDICIASLALSSRANRLVVKRSIWIEMAFGLMVTKWHILHTPINVKLLHLKNY
jgi:hypothetical protein